MAGKTRLILHQTNGGGDIRVIDIQPGVLRISDH